MNTVVHRGHLLHIAGSPQVAEVAQALVSVPDGALVVTGDTISYSGPAVDLPAEYAAAPVRRHEGYLLPGFVDTHLHYPQTFSTDAYGGGQLLNWLQRCIFPAEAKLADPAYATLVAQAFCDRRIAAGTTTALVFGSAFPAAQRALITETRSRGLRLVTGRGVQTVGPAAAAPLLTDAPTALRLVREEISEYHGGPLVDIAVVPRFALSVEPQTMTALGELYDEVRGDGVYFHTHISENNTPGDGEIAATKGAYDIHDYLDAYDGKCLPGSAPSGPSLLGRRSVLAHAVHCTDTELARMAQTGTSIAHCPTSQLFLGSGTMPWQRTIDAGVTVALGSDIGAGDEWLLPRVANDCFKQHMSEPDPAPLHPAQLLFLATLAGARALDREADLGNLDVGKAADFVVVEPHRLPGFAQRLDQIDTADVEALLFALLLGLREGAIAEVQVAGRGLEGAR